MDLKHKTKAARFAAAAAGITAAMLVGMMYPTENKPGPVNVSPARNTQSAVTASVQTEEDDAAAGFIEYRKADIHEYKMASVSSVPLVPLASKDIIAEEEEEITPTEEDLNVEDFAVELPEDGTQVYDIKTEPMNYTRTRSVANEYYTVNDLVSGGVVTMNAHEMLCRMVYNEIGADWDEDAIKAQVVAAYNHLRYNDMTGRVPTIGLKAGYPAKLERCVSAVEGQCIYYSGSVINATYAASTAGYSADSREIFGISYPYLKPVVSQYDSQDPNWGSVKRIAPDTIRRAFKDKYGLELSNDYKSWFEIASVHSGKYAGTVYIDGGRMSLSGAEMRTLLGLKSSAFEISYSGGSFVFTTYGYGHGVGMSQWGAKLYADHGWTYDQILRHYFVNTTISLSDENTNAVQRGIRLAEEAAKAAEKAEKADKSDKADKNDKSDAAVKDDPSSKAETNNDTEQPAQAEKADGSKPDEKAAADPAEESAADTETSTEQTETQPETDEAPAAE